MSGVAILGAGELGGAIAHALAGRGRVRAITFVDDAAGIASGKALDIQQAAPIDRVDVHVSAATDPLAAAGASVIVLADAAESGEWRDDRALALVNRLMRAGTTAAFVFAGPNQMTLMRAASRELGLAGDRIVGTAASAVVGTVRALVGLETDGAGTGVSVTVVGRPPAFVVGWSSATTAGSLVTDRVPAHRLLAVGQALKRFWPPGPRAIASPTTRIVEALVGGSRDLHQAMTILDGEFGCRGGVGMMPLSIGPGRVLARVMPSLSPQERTEIENSLGDGGRV
jgi:malate dehydrogenase